MSRYRSNRAAFAAGIVLALACANTLAAPINYGDFSDGTVIYLDVTETANTPGDTEPLFGAPSIVGGTLSFAPAAFSSNGAAGSADVTDGQLNFTLMALGQNAIPVIAITESGSYSLSGTGGVATQVGYGASITSITLLEVDGAALPVPVALVPASVSGGDDLTGGPHVVSPWNLALSYNVNAALSSANIPFANGATKIEIALDNQLAATSEIQSLAGVSKTAFAIRVQPVPLPGALWLLLGGVTATAAAARRSGAR